MCEAACQNKCRPGAHFKDCGKKAYGQAHGHTKEDIERTAQHCAAVKIPVGLRGATKWPQVQQAHEASRRQSAMHEACAIASALADESRKDDDPEPLAALMRHVGTQEHATLQLLKLVGRIGLRQWFDGDFVVLSREAAKDLEWATRDEVHEKWRAPLIDAIEKAGR